MSQRLQLNDIFRWTKDECQEKIEEAIPFLINTIQDADVPTAQLDAIKLFGTSFMGLIQVKQLETMVYSKVKNEILELFHTIEGRIKNVKKEIGSACLQMLAGSLEELVAILEWAELGLRRYLNASAEAITMATTHSLQTVTLQLVHASFSHCLTSSEIYGDVLNELSSSLSQFFQKVYNLQTTYLLLLDKVTISHNATQDEVDDLVEVCESLYRLSHIVVALDVKIAVSLWKTISRLLTQYKQHLVTEIDVGEMVTYLCHQISIAYSDLLSAIKRDTIDDQGGESKACSKTLRFVGFQMKIIVMLVREYLDQLAGHEKDVYLFIIHLYTLTPPGTPTPPLTKAQLEPLQSHVVNAVEPLVSYLSNSRHFARSCLQKPNMGQESRLSHLFVLMTVIGVLPKMTDETQDQWMRPVSSPDHDQCHNILSAIFHSVEQCKVSIDNSYAKLFGYLCIAHIVGHAEISSGHLLPCVMASGQPQRDVTLYEYICTKVCGFVGCLPARHFTVLEACIIHGVISNAVYVTTLASDITCFIARYGSADLCHQLLSNISSILRELREARPTRQAVTVAALVRRLTSFLSSHHQANLLTQYPAHTSLWFWSVIDWSSLNDAAAVTSRVAVATTCCDGLSHFLHSSHPKQSQLNDVVLYIKSLENMSHTPGLIHPHRRAVLPLVSHTWAWLGLCADFVKSAFLLRELAARLLRLTARLISCFSVDHVAAIFGTLEKLLSSQCGVAVRLAAAEFIPCLESASLPEATEDGVYACISRVCGLLVTDDHPTVLYVANSNVARCLVTCRPSHRLHVQLSSLAGMYGQLQKPRPVHSSEQHDILLTTMEKFRDQLHSNHSDLPLAVKSTLREHAQEIVDALS